MRLYFVRHGESEANLSRVFSNRGFKHPLTPRGIAQAHALAAKLAGQTITQIFSSPLQRAIQTSEILSQAFGVPAVVTRALCEWDVGMFEDTADQHGWDVHRQVQEDWFVHKRLDRKIPGGESFLDIQARFVPFIQQLIQQATHPSETVVLVGHGGLYHAMLPLILHNIDYGFVARHPFDNTAYALAETYRDRLYCREWCGIPIEQAER